MGRRRATGYRAPKPLQRRQCGRPEDPVGAQADVALEVAQRARGVPAEDPVTTTGIKAEVEQPLLERDDVVTDVRVVQRVGQRSVAEAPPRLVERAVGLLANDAVDAQPALLL